jgi:hypothetical protein
MDINSKLNKIFYTIILVISSLGFYAIGISTNELAIDIVSLILQLLTLIVLVALWAPNPLSSRALKILGITLGLILLLLLLANLVFLTAPEVRHSHSPHLLMQTALAFATVGLPAILYGLKR